MGALRRFCCWLLSRWRPRVTAASGFHPVISTTQDEFKHLCEQPLSSHGLGILHLLGHSYLRCNQLSGRFSCAASHPETYLWLQLWHLHLAPCQKCRRTCIPRSHPPVVYWFCDKKETKHSHISSTLTYSSSWLISSQVNKVAYFRSAVISLDCKLWKLGGLTKPGEGRILA